MINDPQNPLGWVHGTLIRFPIGSQPGSVAGHYHFFDDGHRLLIDDRAVDQMARIYNIATMFRDGRLTKERFIEGIDLIMSK